MRKREPTSILKSWLVPFKPMPDASSFIETFRAQMRDRMAQFHKLKTDEQEKAIDDMLKGIWLFIEDARQCANYSLSPVETLYGFCAWLTTREKPTILSAQHDSSVTVPLISRFAKAQGWDTKCRDYWHQHVVRVPETVGDQPAPAEF